MELRSRNSTTGRVVLTGAELTLARNMLTLALDEENIMVSEFQTRLGWERDEGLRLHERLADLEAGDVVELDVTADDIGILAQSANEVCNGFRVDDFEAQVGSEGAANELHEGLRELYDLLTAPAGE